MRLPRRGRGFAAIALLTITLLLGACGATEAPANDPTDPTSPATFGEATFDSSTWR
jgi:hypothetical protein